MNTLGNRSPLLLVLRVIHDRLVEIAVSNMSNDARKETELSRVLFRQCCRPFLISGRVSRLSIKHLQSFQDVLIISANLEIGTATSVDQREYPSGLIEVIVQRASFLAAHRSASSCLFLAKKTLRGLNGCTISLTLATSPLMPSVVPANLNNQCQHL